MSVLLFSALVMMCIYIIFLLKRRLHCSPTKMIMNIIVGCKEQERSKMGKEKMSNIGHILISLELESSAIVFY
jgi:hypothetical protein